MHLHVHTECLDLKMHFALLTSDGLIHRDLHIGWMESGAQGETRLT